MCRATLQYGPAVQESQTRGNGEDCLWGNFPGVSIRRFGNAYADRKLWTSLKICAYFPLLENYSIVSPRPHLPISNYTICSFWGNILERKNNHNNEKITIPPKKLHPNKQNQKIPNKHNLFVLHLSLLNLHGPISRRADLEKTAWNSSSSTAAIPLTTKAICNLCWLQ